MKTEGTKIDQRGLMRCCLLTLVDLDPQADYAEGHIVRCAYDTSMLGEAPHQMILRDGVWAWWKCQANEHIWMRWGCRVVCSICNMAGGWFCDASPSMQCQASVESAPADEMESCVFCGERHGPFSYSNRPA